MCPHTPAERRIRDCIAHNRERLFTVSYAKALSQLRAALHALNVPEPSTFAFHAFRRGFSQDLLKAQTPLRDILAACDWSSQTFAWYLSREKIDEGAVLAAAAELSDDEDDSSPSDSSSTVPTARTVALGSVQLAQSQTFSLCRRAHDHSHWGGDAQDKDSAIGQSTSASSVENPTHASQGRCPNVGDTTAKLCARGREE